jgi:hypothetical protein
LVLDGHDIGLNHYDSGLEDASLSLEEENQAVELLVTRACSNRIEGTTIHLLDALLSPMEVGHHLGCAPFCDLRGIKWRMGHVKSIVRIREVDKYPS